MKHRPARTTAVTASNAKQTRDSPAVCRTNGPPNDASGTLNAEHAHQDGDTSTSSTVMLSVPPASLAAATSRWQQRSRDGSSAMIRSICGSGTKPVRPSLHKRKRSWAAQLDPVDFRQRLGRHADVASHLAVRRMCGGFVDHDLLTIEQELDQRVIARQRPQRAVAQQVSATVAQMRDDALVLANEQEDQRGAHSVEARRVARLGPQVVAQLAD